MMCDIVWADPLDDEVADKYEFIENEERSCSFKYGLKPTKSILESTDCELIIRAH